MHRLDAQNMYCVSPPLCPIFVPAAVTNGIRSSNATQSKWTPGNIGVIGTWYSLK